jgi:hypothetical protein
MKKLNQTKIQVAATKQCVAAMKQCIEEYDELNKKQRKVMRVHENHRRLDEKAFYPDHPERTESHEYIKTHRRLVRDKKLPCIICGVTYEILSDPEKRENPKLNPYGAIQLETHHHVVEWALANAVDPDAISSPIWGPQDILKPKFISAVKAEIKKAQKAQDESNKKITKSKKHPTSKKV